MISFWNQKLKPHVSFTLQVRAHMTDFILKQLPYDLSNQAGLALIGKYLKHINIKRLVDPAFPVRCGAPNSDILKMVPCGYMPLDVDTFATALLHKAHPTTLIASAHD